MVEQIIVRSEDQTVKGLSVESIRPMAGKSFARQVDSCIEQLFNFIFPSGETRYFITQQTFFIASKSRKEYEERSSLIMKKVSACCGTILPATSIVAQSPARGSEVVLELISSKAAEGKEVLYKSAGASPYTVVNYGTFKVVHATGLMGGPEDSIEVAADKAFKSAMEILDGGGLTIDHIIRQWNYVEDIANVEDPSRTTTMK